MSNNNKSVDTISVKNKYSENDKKLKNDKIQTDLNNFKHISDNKNLKEYLKSKLIASIQPSQEINDELTFYKNIKVKSLNFSINDLKDNVKFLVENKGNEIKKMNENELPKCGKVVFIICNPYFNTDYKLGNPVCNDCKMIAKLYKHHDYKCYCLFDGYKEDFIRYLKFFVSNEYEDLIIYYSSHGMEIEKDIYEFDYDLNKFICLDKNENENNQDKSESEDECLIFKDEKKEGINIIIDNELTHYINLNKSKHSLVICDCCHCGTILDKVPKNCCCISSCLDKEQSIQISANGIFTYYLIKYFNYEIENLVKNINMRIERYNQHPVLFNNSKRQYLYL